MAKIVLHYQTGTSIFNDKGRILNGGNIGSSRFTKLALGRKITGDYGSRLVSTMSGLAKAISAGSFATMTAGAYIISKVTTTIAGVSNTILRSGAADFGSRHSIHKVQRVRNTFLSGLSWTAHYPTNTINYTRSTTDVSLGTDEATLAPGDVTFLSGSNIPHETDLPARKEW